jgi:protoheme ferro-lyase
VQFAPWAAVLIAGIAGGVVTCAAMVVPRRRVPWAGLPGTAAIAVVVLAAGAIWHATSRVDALIAFAFIAIGACGGGYALASSLVAALTRTRPSRPRIPRTAATDDRISVVLLSDAEPERYDPSAVTAVLDRYESAEVPLPPDVARPLVYASERSRYHQAVASPAREAARATARALAARLETDAIAASVRVAFCNGAPSLSDVLADLASSGVHRVVVAGLTVAWTRAFATALSEATDSGVAAAGFHVEVTDPMWASPHIAEMAAQRALSALVGDPLAGGVVLLEEGEPWQWNREDPASEEQATFFAQRVRAELVEAGLAANRIRRAWLEWEEPDVSEATRHLAAVGATRIVLLPVTFPVETLATTLDLHAAAERAAEETGASTVVLRAWGDDPAVIQSLVEAIGVAAQRLQRQDRPATPRSNRV